MVYKNKKQATISIGLAGILLLFILGCSPRADEGQYPSNATNKPIELTVSAAASLRDAMVEIENLYEGQNPNISLILNLASSGSLRQQIEQGAPVDVFISAAEKHINILQQKSLIADETRRNLLKNSMVLIVPQDNLASINSFQDLSQSNYQQFSIAEPESAPAGRYAREVLTNLGIFERVKSKIVYAKDVRQVLSYVATNNVDAGIVYQTDANISDQVKIVEIAPENAHATVVYPMAIVKGTKNSEAAVEFIDFMFGTEAKAVFEKYGFITVELSGGQE